jgi:3-hydroxyacyl-[acyl-carrier-protein] dehydratase
MELSIHEILRIIPHRYPFVLVDRILEMEPGKRAVGLKNVSFNEEFFQGHFPGNPVMPGVLVVEAMAQTAAVCLLASVDHRDDRVPYFTGIDACKFRRPVVPGDQLRLELEIITAKLRLCKARGRALVDGHLCAEAVIFSSIVEKPRG